MPLWAARGHLGWAEALAARDDARAASEALRSPEGIGASGHFQVERVPQAARGAYPKYLRMQPQRAILTTLS